MTKPPTDSQIDLMKVNEWSYFSNKAFHLHLHRMSALRQRMKVSTLTAGP